MALIDSANECNDESETVEEHDRAKKKDCNGSNSGESRWSEVRKEQCHGSRRNIISSVRIVVKDKIYKLKIEEPVFLIDMFFIFKHVKRKNFTR